MFFRFLFLGRCWRLRLIEASLGSLQDLQGLLQALRDLLDARGGLLHAVLRLLDALECARDMRDELLEDLVRIEVDIVLELLRLCLAASIISFDCCCVCCRISLPRCFDCMTISLCSTIRAAWSCASLRMCSASRCASLRMPSRCFMMASAFSSSFGRSLRSSST